MQYWNINNQNLNASVLYIFSIVVHFLIITGISFFYFKNFSGPLKKFYWSGLTLKLFCGIAYGLIYQHYFGYGDTFSYFQTGSKIALLAKNNFSDYLRLLFLNDIPDSIQLAFTHLNNPRAYWISKAISPFLILAGNNYWLTATYMSLFSFLGTYFLANTLAKTYPSYNTLVAISFFFFPSFVLWSSGLTKESVAIGSLFYMIAVCFAVLNGDSTKYYHWLLFLLFFWFEWQIRFFYLAVFLLTFGFYTVMQTITRTLSLSRISRVSIAVSIFLMSVIIVSQMDFALSFMNFTNILVLAYETDFVKNPANAIQYFDLRPTFSSILINSPLALVSGLFRPSIFDIQSIPMVFVALENLVLIMLFVFQIKNIVREENQIKVVWAFILILALFLALSSPNFGTLTRYKVAFLPFLLFFLLKDNNLILRVRKMIRSDQ